MAQINQHKVVASLPDPLEANSIYYVRVGAGFDQYVTNGSGTIVAYQSNAKLELEGKVDKEEGKVLSSNDYTTAEKNKLASLENFDDSAIQAELATKVDKVAGKGLSDQNYTLAEKNKLGGIEAGAQVNSVTSVAGKTGAVTLVKADVGLGNVDNTSDANKPISTATATALSGKVDKVNGKQLSTEDYTTAEKNKLAGIEAGAQVNVATNIGQGSRTSTTIPLTSSTGTGTTLPSATTSLAGLQSAADKAKLDGIAAGATANATDAQLRDRATHTGVQPIASVEGLQDTLDEKVDNTDSRLTNAREWTASVVTQAEAEAGTSTTARKWTAQRVRQAILGWWNTSTFKTKLDGIETGATKNATDAQLRDRSTHTGTQPISSVTNLQSSLDSKVDKVAGYGLSQENFTPAEKSKLASIEGSKFKGEYVSLAALIAAHPSPEVGSYAYVDAGVGEVVSKYIWDSSDAEWVKQQGETAALTPAEIKTLYEENPDTNAFTDSEKTKLSGIQAGATANATNAQLRDRSTHTGTQAISTVSGLQTALDGKVNNDDTRLTNARDWTASTVTQAEAEAGTATTARKWTAQRVRQAILGWWNSSAEKTKLDGIATGATKNATDAQLRDRATHTGVQPISSVDGLQSAIDNKVDNDDARLTDSREWTASLVSQAEAEAGTATTARKWTAQRVRQAILGWWNSSAEKTKLDGIATGATKNATDAQLRDRSTHTGTQAISTVSGLQTALDAKVDKVTGMGLSEESFTTAEKNKLEGIEPGAQVNVGTNLAMGGSGNSRTITSSTGNNVSVPVATTSAAGFMSTTDKSKLDGLSNVNLIAGSNVSLSGAYPNITISSTNTTYSEIPESEVTTGTASTARAISARRLKFAIDTHGLKIGTTSTTAKAGNWTPTWGDVSGKPTTFTPSAHTHTLSDITDAGSVAGISTNGSTTNFLRGDGTWVTPPNTNTTYSEITTAEIDAGTATTLRTITGRRMKYALDKKADTVHGHSVSDITGLQTELDNKADTSYVNTQLDGKVDKTVSVVAGTGLSGGGALSADRTLNVQYGTTAGTAAQGNDARLSDNREWTASTVTQAEAEAGTATTRRAWTSQRVRQAILGWWNSSTEKAKLDGIESGAQVNSVTSVAGKTGAVTLTYTDVDAAPTSHSHPLSQITDAGTVAALNTNGSTANFLRGDGTWVTPPNTTYSEITTAEIDAGTASTSRTITGRRMKYALDKKADVSHTHTLSQITDAGNVAALNTNSSTTNFLRGDGTWATPPNTTYSEISEAEVTAGTASTARAISARRLKFAVDTHGLKIGTTSTTAKAGNWTPSAADIPNLDASKITSGTLADARIPNLSAGKITSGTIGNARLSGIYDGITLKINGANTVFTTPSSGSSNSSARTVYGLAEFRASASSTVGAIVFIAPDTTHTVMHEVEIAGMLYNNSIVRLTIQGYRSGATANWTATRKISTGTVDVPARWGLTPDGKACIILGDVDSTWSYPHFSIIRAMFSHSNVSDTYCSGWTTALVTDLTEYTRVTSFISDSAMVGSISGNAGSATKLATARTINGTSFNGTANITTANWGTARTLTIGATGKSVNGSANVSWSLSDIGAAAASHTHSMSDVSGLGNVAGISTNGSTANYLRGDGTWVTPPNTTYSEITTAEIDAGTASTSRTISGRRMKYALDKKADAVHGHSISDVTGLQTALDSKADTSYVNTQLDGKVDKTVSVVAGTGLSGGGTLSANRTLSVIYGTTAGTAAQGNDSRLSDSREWTAAIVSQVEAEAGTATTARKWTAQRVRQAAIAALDTYVPGMGQTWQDLTADRSIETIYTNTTGRSIYVSIALYETGATNLDLEVDGVTIGRVGAWESGNGTFSAVVPNGSTYRVHRTSGSTGTIRSWAELR